MKSEYRPLLQNSNYRRLLSANLINRFGDSVDALAMSWLMYTVSRSASLTALNFALNFLPTVLLQPFCGAWVEKRDLKRIMVTADLCRAALIGTVAVLAWLERAESWMLLGFTLLISTVEAFRVPSQTAVIPRVLRQEDYAPGQSLSASLSSAVQLIGTALAGSIIAIFGVSAGIFLDTACFLASALLLAGLRLPEREAAPGESRVWRDLTEGLRYVRDHRILWVIALLALLINALAAPFSSLEAAMCAELFQKGPEVISLIGAAITLGNILGSAVYPRVEKRLRPMTLMRLCYSLVAVFYAAAVLAGAARDKAPIFYTLVSVVPFVFGVSVAWINIFASVLMLRSVAPEYLSRVSAITGALCSLGMPITSFLVSAAAARFSVGTIFLGAAALTLLSTIVIGKNKTLRAQGSVPADEA